MNDWDMNTELRKLEAGIMRLRRVTLVNCALAVLDVAGVLNRLVREVDRMRREDR